MNLLTSVQRYLMVLILFGAVLPVPEVLADETLADIQQQISVLEQEAAQTTDFNRLMQIADKLTQLASQLQVMTGELPAIPSKRGATPDEEVNRIIQAINSSYERQKIVFAGYTEANAPLVPIPRTRKLHGSLEVRGSNQRKSSETPYEGGVSKTLQYTIKEDFVGYLTITEYYDPNTGKFVDKKDYWISTISQKIHPPAFSGKECVEIVGNNWKACKKWEQYGLYKIDEENHTYQAVHDWVIIGSPEDNGIKLKIETPDIIFSTAKNNRSRGQGCYGANMYMSNVDFALDIEDNKLTLQESVGGEFKGSPHCGIGSTVTVNIEICKETPRCEQLEPLLSKILWAIDLRDKYGAMAAVAESETDLHAMVNLDLNDRYPNLDIQDKQFLEDNAGGYNIRKGITILPNLCKGCATMPLCFWDREGLRVHEKTHELDVLADPILKKLFTDTQYQMENYNANELAKEQALQWGKLDYHAYDENARFLMDILQKELSQSMGCDLSPQFYSDLDKAIDALK